MSIDVLIVCAAVGALSVRVLWVEARGMEVRAGIVQGFIQDMKNISKKRETKDRGMFARDF
jgi:hypothetical protein